MNTMNAERITDRRTSLSLVANQDEIDARAMRSVLAARTRPPLVRPPSRFMPEVGQGLGCALLGLFDLCLIGYLVWQVMRRH